MRTRHSNPPAALDRQALEAIALRYVERFQTTQARLERYLRDKIRQRGWQGDEPADPEAIAAHLVELGYINDAAFATARAQAMERRGLGARRLRQTLAAYGVTEETSASAAADINPWAAALAFARRRRLGPFGPAVTDPKKRERQFSAMLRAGHQASQSRAILSAATVADAEALTDRSDY